MVRKPIKPKKEAINRERVQFTVPWDVAMVLRNMTGNLPKLADAMARVIFEKHMYDTDALIRAYPKAKDAIRRVREYSRDHNIQDKSGY